MVEDVIHARSGNAASEVVVPLSTGQRFLEFAINKSPSNLFQGSEFDKAVSDKFGPDVIDGLNETIDGETCVPFPFCDENGCSQWQLMTLIAFQLLLLVLIVISNVTIIAVIFDMNKSTRNRRKGMRIL